MSFCNLAKAKDLQNKFDTFVESHVQTAISVANVVRGFIDTVANIADFISPVTAVVADKYKPIIDTALNQALTALGVVKDCGEQTDPNSKLACYILALRDNTGISQNGMIFKLASTLAQILHQADNGNSGTLPEHYYDSYIQAQVAMSKPVA